MKISTALQEAMTLAYASELTLEQYELFESLLTPTAKSGRARSVNLMLVMQGILYVLVSGCAWRLLPKAYPPYSTVYYYFRKWRDDGSWKRIHDHLALVGEGRCQSQQYSNSSESGFAKRSDCCDGSPSRGLRWRQENQRSQTLYAG